MDTTIRRPLATGLGSRRRVAGVIGAVGGIAWVPLVIAEGGDSSNASIGVGLGFAVATACYVVMLLAVHGARPAGDGRAPRVFTAILLIAWIALLASQLIELTTPYSAEFVGAIGGLGQVVALTGAGVLAVRTGSWSGWRRWWLLAMAAFFVFVVFVPAVLGIEPSLVTESVWALSYAGLGLALVAES